MAKKKLLPPWVQIGRRSINLQAVAWVERLPDGDYHIHFSGAQPPPLTPDDRRLVVAELLERGMPLPDPYVPRSGKRGRTAEIKY